jgi:hypothetical protein
VHGGHAWFRTVEEVKSGKCEGKNELGRNGTQRIWN